MTGRNLDDYLALLDRDLGQSDLVVFTGPSGSGKSSQIRLLLDRHSAYSGLEPVEFRPAGGHFRWRQARKEPLPSGTVLVIDEILTPRDFFGALLSVRRAHRALVASHLPAAWFRLAGLDPLCFATGDCTGKLSRFLDQRGVSYTGADMDRYVNRYGPVYTELQIMLEAHPGTNLGDVWKQFHRFRQIRRDRAPRWLFRQ